MKEERRQRGKEKERGREYILYWIHMGIKGNTLHESMALCHTVFMDFNGQKGKQGVGLKKLQS